MEHTPPDTAIATKVELLLQKHADLQRRFAALQAESALLSAERDLLRSKHAAARARIDALLERLHPTPHAPLPAAASTAPESNHEAG
jgi:FtsZ-binding cell division protein ZapB